jgi:hypothetical protein
MQLIRHHARRIAGATLLAFASLTLVVPAAQAGMVGTEQALAGAAASEARSALATTLARADVQTRLTDLGVDPAVVAARVAALSDSEVQTLNTRLGELPAGGDIVGAVVFVFLILLITDIAGLTDVFPFVKK